MLLSTLAQKFSLQRGILLICLFLSTSLSFGQDKLSNDRFAEAISLLAKNRLKNSFFTPNEKQLNETEVLMKLSKKQYVSYPSLNTIVLRMLEVKQDNVKSLHSFSTQFIHPPGSFKKVDLAYVKLKFLEISEYRNRNAMKLANEEQSRLKNYVDRIKTKDENYQKAQVYAAIHDIVLTQIQYDFEKAEKMCQEIEKTSRALNDTGLIILSLYYSCDSYIGLSKLDAFIQASEESIRLDSLQETKSAYLLQTQMHLVDAYIYAGTHPERTLELLKNIHRTTRVESYAYISKYLASIPPESQEAREILELVGTDNIVDYYFMAKKEAEHTLYPNDFYHLLRESAHALENFGEHETALYAMEDANAKLRKIYTQDLAQSIADHKLELLEREKDFKAEKAQIKEKNQIEVSNLYKISLVIVAVLLTFLTILFIRKIKQNTKLKKKNLLIKQQEAEKALLMKELHHRVKNNFQIISSIMDLQSKDISDEHAKQLAKEGQQRVKAMALIHQKLYQNDDMKIELEDFIDKLTKNINDMFSLSEIKTFIHVQNSPLDVDLDTAIPLGLILNELITNSFKYAFNSSTENNELHIDVERDPDSYLLRFRDNGKGLPGNFNFKETQSLGLKLVSRLARQLHGSVTYSYVNGAQFEIRYKDAAMRSETD